MEYFTDNEIACTEEANAIKLAKILLNEGHVVLLSKEEDLTIVNFEYSEYSDRNDVVFMNREMFEHQLFEGADNNNEEVEE